MTTQKNGLLCLLLMAFFLVLPVHAAQADLTITPVRVVIEGRTRSAEVQLLNLTNRTNTYRLSWSKMVMGPGGKFILLPDNDDKDPNSVANMVIFTPRQVTIAPHGQQTIRLSLRRPADLPFGEYRRHLTLTRLANAGPDRRNPNDKNVSMELNVNLGFSVPVIVRSGEDKDLKISLESPKLGMGGTGNKQVPQLSVSLTRTAGTFSVYGNAHVFWQPPQGSEKEIGGLNNMVLYPEVKNRLLEIPLNANPTGGRLRLTFTGKYESEGTTWDEKVFPIGN